MTATAARKVNIGVQTRAASFEPASFNAEKRTVDLTWTTGAKGLRSSFWSEPYHEELEVSAQAVRLGRLNSGAPLLNSHRGYGLEGVIGVVESARIENGQGVATVRFADDEDSAAIMRKVQDGILRNISVGYQVHRYKDVSAEGDRLKTYRAVDWEPMELSIVPIPFDAAAQVRAGAELAIETEFITPELPGKTRSESPMEVKTQEAPAAPVVDVAQERKQAAAEGVAVERKRIADITALCRQHSVGADVEQRMITGDTTIEQARAVVLDTLAERSKETQIKGGTRIEAGDQDEHVTRSEGLAEAILHRANPSVHKLTDNGKRFFGLSLVEMGRVHLEAHGVRTVGMARHVLASTALSFRAGMHSTSDFPYVLANVANKSLLSGYQLLEAKQTFLPIARGAFTPDFKTVSRVRRGEAPNLVVVPEGAEVSYGTFGESREQYSVATYGRIVAVTEETIVNDDLNAFTRLPQDMGMAAARLESDVVWGVLTANAAMGDGTTLFHADHGNIGSSAAISITSIAEAEKLMMLQKGVDALAPLNIMPRYLIVPAALKATAEQFVSQNLLASDATKVNPYAGKLTVIAEARLDATDATDWYLAASPDDGVDIIETLRLEGTSGPVTEMKQGWERNGVEIKVKHYFAAKALDWRGLVFNEGGS